MSYGKSLTTALHRSVDAIRHSTAQALRMQVAPSAASQGPLGIWSISSSDDVHQFATGCDKDIGGLSTAQLDAHEGAGRFWGTLSNQLPRGSRIERTGYAGMRNRNRPTLFGLQTWDTSLHPFLVFRLRNRVAHLSPPSPHQPSPLSQTTEYFSTLDAQERAKVSLGYGLEEPLGPKYFVNIQTDGPVTSDLFQHRLWLDFAAGNQWQTIVVPLNRFLLLNMGSLSAHQVVMMRQAIRTVGISCTLDTPRLPASATPLSAYKTAAVSEEHGGGSTAAPSALRASTSSSSGVSLAWHQLAAKPQQQASSDAAQAIQEHQQQREQQVLDEADDWARDGKLHDGDRPAAGNPKSPMRGSKRGQSFRFDLGIAGVKAVASVEEAHELTW